MYRRRTKGSQKYNQAAMRDGKNRARMARPVEDRLPSREGKLCLRFTAENFEFDESIKHVFELVGTKRCDSYRVFVDGVELPKLMGRTAVTVLARKAFPRVLSTRNL